MYAERLPPHDIDAEESGIGSILIDGDSLNKVTPFLKASDFYAEKSRWCYEAAISLVEKGDPVDQVSISHELALLDRLEGVGGTEYIAHLVMVVPTSVHIEHYGNIVRRTSIMRQLIQVGGDIAAIGYEGSSDPETSLSKAEELLFRVRSGKRATDFTHLRDILDTYIEETAGVHDPDFSHLQPIATGFTDFDKLMAGGLQRSDLVVLAARPSLGKSTLAFNMARHAAGQGARVGIFSLEMSSAQIALRLLSSESSIDGYRLRVGLLSEAEETRQQDAIGALSDLPLHIDDTPVQGIVEMRGKARRLQTERGLDMLVVDYLQLISGVGRTDNRASEMGEISRSLKGLARDLDIPVLACSQLSRAVEQRPTHRPLLSDLRESGSIEQDADVVAFIYREDVYTSREEWEKRNPSDQYPENIAELIVSKHRNGPLGTIPLYFRNEIVKFESATPVSKSVEFA
ncbi:MAG: replicative DNA helicase [Chloroflexota bacterium]|nr:replicative DNA helicase [Chloroflexota bacterium]